MTAAWRTDTRIGTRRQDKTVITTRMAKACVAGLAGELASHKAVESTAIRMSCDDCMMSRTESV